MKRTLHLATLALAAVVGACSPSQGELDTHPDGVLVVVEESWRSAHDARCRERASDPQRETRLAAARGGDRR